MDSNSIVTVAGAKGGVGKTTTSINLGAAVAAKGHRVVVVELDLAMANVVDFLSLPRAEDDPTLHDVLAGDAALSAAVYSVSENFAVAPSGTDLEGYISVDFDRLSAVLDDLREAFDLVIVDTGAGLSRATVEPIRLADATLLVSTPRVAAIRDVDKTKTLSERVGTPTCGLLLTKSGTGASPGPERIADFLDVSLLGHVPEDEAVPASQDSGAPVVESAPDSAAAIQYHRVANTLPTTLETIQSGTPDQSDSSQAANEPSEDGQTPSGGSVPEWMDEAEDSTAETDPHTRQKPQRKAMSDGQGHSRYGTTRGDGGTVSEPGDHASNARPRTENLAAETGTRDEDSTDQRDAAAPSSKRTDTPATGAPEANRRDAAVPTEEFVTETAGEPTGESAGESGSESASGATTGAVSDTEHRDERTESDSQTAETTETGVDSASEDDSVSEDESNSRSLTGRVWSFVGRLSPGT